MTTFNKTELKKRLFFNLIQSPFTLFPVTIGTTALLFGLAEGRFVKAAFIGGFLMLAGVGGFLTRFFLSGENIAKEIAKELENEIQNEREIELNELDKKLTYDGDKRTQYLLRDLRAMVKNFGEGREIWSDNFQAGVFVDITSKVESLFEESIHSLGKTLELKEKSKQIRSKKAKQPLVDRREKLIVSIEKSIAQIGTTLVKMEELESKEAIKGSDKLSDIGKELDMAIQVAVAVEERLEGKSDEAAEAEFLAAAQ